MTIDATQRKAIAAGQTLTAKYKGAEHRCEVVTGEDGKRRFRLDDGREFKSPSSAGSAVMDGVACNGWRFWSLADGATTTASKPANGTKANATKAKTEAAKPERPRCEACGKHFMSAKQLEHHTANAERLCRPA